MDHPSNAASSSLREDSQQHAVPESASSTARISNFGGNTVSSGGGISSAAGAGAARSPLPVDPTNSGTSSSALLPLQRNVGSELSAQLPHDQQLPTLGGSNSFLTTLQPVAMPDVSSSEFAWTSVKVDESLPLPPLPPGHSAQPQRLIRNATGAGGTRQRLYSDPHKEVTGIVASQHVSESDPDPDRLTDSSLQRAQHKRSVSAPISGPVLVAAVQQSILATPSIINSVQPRQEVQPLPPIYNYDEKPGDHDIVEQSPQGRYVRFVEKLGSGAYKDVYRSYDTIEGIEVAWNQVNLSGLPKGDKARIINEVRLLERLHHANIISFHGSWVNREKEQVIFVTEMLSSGTLKSFINKVKVIRWKIAKRWAIQILKGLEYLHSQDPPIIHRDLKCDNIFINGATGDLRIGDLGLSTVISQKTKVLSVLGTPEFMAPELYDESYDEKVDIYAFGMCLLEIFTKEVPYRECHNPAQIYKKVTNRIPPASLARVKSKEAQDFIMLCLGTPDEDGMYHRPSATELLQHPFLAKCPDDESEVEVIPPIPETVLEETNSLEDLDASIESFLQLSSSGDVVAGSSTAMTHDTGFRGMSGDSLLSNPQLSNMQPIASTILASSNSLDDDTLSDHLSSMPDSEENMRKVKVLMGRGQEIEDEEIHQPPNVVLVEDKLESALSQPQKRPSVDNSSTIPQNPNPASNVTMNGQPPLTQHYPVAAYGAEEIQQDVMKLIITLPYEGKTSNVQFDFHLIQDDPVQVAREMVTELGIPESAVLEISETISGLARAARIKQEKYRQQQVLAQQQQQQTATAPIAPAAVAVPMIHVPHPQQPAGPAPVAAPVVHVPRSVQPSPAQGQSAPVVNAPQSVQPASPQLQPVAPPSAAPSVVNTAQLQQAALARNQTPPSQQAGAQPQHGQQYLSTPPIASLQPPKQVQLTQAYPPQQPQHQLQQTQPQQVLHHPPAQGSQELNSVKVNGAALQQSKHHTEGMNDNRGADYFASPVQPQPISRMTSDSATASSYASVAAQVPSPPTSLGDATPLRSGSGSKRQENFIDALERNVSNDDDSSYGTTDDNREELRRMEEEYQKTLQRAKKVYDSRMENLQRSLIEREAQHRQNMMKHEKERAEFEKKVKLAEAEQNRRLQELEEKWRQQKAELVKGKHQNGMRKRVMSGILPSAMRESDAESNVGQQSKSSSDLPSMNDVMRS